MRHQMLQLRQLLFGYHSHYDRSFLGRISTGCFQDRCPALKYLMNTVHNFRMLIGYDHHITCIMSTNHHGFIDHIAAYPDRQNSCKCSLQSVYGSTKKYGKSVHNQNQCRKRYMGILVDNQGRNIHSSCAGSCTKHTAYTDAHQRTAVNGG